MEAIRKFLILDISKQHFAGFRRETTITNMHRARMVGITLAFLEVLMIIGALVSAEWRWSGTPRSHYLLLYSLMMAVQCSLLLVWRWAERQGNLRVAQVLLIGFTLWVLGWGALVSLLDQLIYPAVTVYVAGIFAVAIITYLPPLAMACIYLLVEAAFVLLLPHFQPSPALAMGHTANTVTLVVLGWVLSRTLYANRLRDFVQRAEIQAKNQELEEINRRLQVISSIDGLTKLLNRNTIEARMEQLWSECLESRSSLAVLMVDIDSFKAYNDAYGHQAGDRALQQVAAVMLSSVENSSAMVGRYGGEEFIIALPREQAEESSLVAERIRLEVQALGIMHRLSPLAPVLTVSIGHHSAIPASGTPLEAFIHMADQALYQAKAEQGNRTCQYGKMK